VAAARTIAKAGLRETNITKRGIDIKTITLYKNFAPCCADFRRYRLAVILADNACSSSSDDGQFLLRHYWAGGTDGCI
jgi:hypothetical protein